MTILLDTHVAIWFVDGDKRISNRTRALIERDSMPCVSVASIWEIAVKHAIRRGGTRAFHLSGAQAIEHFEEAGFTLLDVTPAHAAEVDNLPVQHGDPFDRLLVAQARVEGMRLITHDETMAVYGTDVVIV